MSPQLLLRPSSRGGLVPTIRLTQPKGAGSPKHCVLSRAQAGGGAEEAHLLWLLDSAEAPSLPAAAASRPGSGSTGTGLFLFLGPLLVSVQNPASMGCVNLPHQWELWPQPHSSAAGWSRCQGWLHSTWLSHQVLPALASQGAKRVGGKEGLCRGYIAHSPGATSHSPQVPCAVAIFTAPGSASFYLPCTCSEAGSMHRPALMTNSEFQKTFAASNLAGSLGVPTNSSARQISQSQPPS